MALKLSGMVSGMDTESMVAELMKAQKLKTTKLQNKITTTEWKKDKWKDLNSKIYSFYTGSLSKIKMQGSFNIKTATSSNEAKAEVTAGTTAAEGTHELYINKLAKAQFVTGATLGSSVTSSTTLASLGMAASGTDNQITVKAGTTTKSLIISDTTTIADVTKTFADAGLNASFDATQKRFFISSKASGTDNIFSVSTSGTVDLTKLGLNTITDNGDGTVTEAGTNMTLTDAQNAEYYYNGVKMTSSSNTASVNGLSITLKGITDVNNTPDDTSDDTAISLGVKNNSQAVYDMVKEFASKYNELIKTMNEAYDASSAKGYDPLTDDEKNSMTDTQIEKWETKIKDSLLRRDGTLDTLTSSMRTTMGGYVDVNGSKYSLASFGVLSQNYSEKGLLHINGNKDDSAVSGLEDKLMKAINENPEAVKKTFTELASKLYSSLTDKMRSSTLRSALTVYNDKEMTKSITNYKEDLSELEIKLQKMERRYYKQFTAMEKAMSQSNSQTSSLQSLLGNN